MEEEGGCAGQVALQAHLRPPTSLSKEGGPSRIACPSNATTYSYEGHDDKLELESPESRTLIRCHALSARLMKAVVFCDRGNSLHQAA